MSVVKMQKIGICANKRHRKDILEFLQDTGAMEVTAVKAGEGAFPAKDTTGQRIEFEKAADSFEKALELLDSYAPVKEKGLSLFSETRLVTRAEADEVVRRRQELSAEAKQILDAEKEITECKGAIQKDENLIVSLVPWASLDIPMDSTGTKETEILIGSVPESTDAASLYAKACEGLEGDAPVSVDVISTEKAVTNLCVICRRTVAEKVEENLRAGGFARAASPVHGVPKEVSLEAEADIEKRRARIEEVSKEIAAHADSRQDFKVAADYYRTRAEKYRVLGTLPQSENTFFLTGWVPADKVDGLANVLSERFDAYVGPEEPPRARCVRPF